MIHNLTKPATAWLPVIAALTAGSISMARADELERIFSQPPAAARPGVWWHWMGCNVTKEGITKDLAAFKDADIGSATIFGLADVSEPWAAGITSWKPKPSPANRLLACDRNTPAGSSRSATRRSSPGSTGSCSTMRCINRGLTSITFDNLEDWTSRQEPGIRYYSGTAMYRKTFDVQKSQIPNLKSQIQLDLGTVHQLARVRLNGQDLGVVWCAPWHALVPLDLLKPAANQMEIEVTNVWANRLIGDEQHPQDCEWKPSSMKGGSY
jgi:hypothetical protein